MFVAAPRQWLRHLAYMPDIEIPPGYVLELPGRGSTYVTDVAGPPGAPTIVLLHAVGCTGMLTWFPVVPALSAHYRVVVFDQRWHGQGIASEHFSLYDCADDVAAVIDALGLENVFVAGYSMGSIVAQRMWRQHPDKVSGLILCATTDYFRTTPSEVIFHESLEIAMFGLRSLSRSQTVRKATRSTARALRLEPSDIHDWALAELRSTSPWAVGQAIAALGRHHSTPWLSKIDVPTAVLITAHDKVIPLERQRELAARIPTATVHEIAAGHASCVLQADIFLAGLLEACATTVARADERVA